MNSRISANDGADDGEEQYMQALRMLLTQHSMLTALDDTKKKDIHWDKALPTKKKVVCVSPS